MRRRSSLWMMVCVVSRCWNIREDSGTRSHLTQHPMRWRMKRYLGTLRYHSILLYVAHELMEIWYGTLNVLTTTMVVDCLWIPGSEWRTVFLNPTWKMKRWMHGSNNTLWEQHDTTNNEQEQQLPASLSRDVPIPIWFHMLYFSLFVNPQHQFLASSIMFTIAIICNVTMATANTLRLVAAVYTDTILPCAAPELAHVVTLPS